MIILNEQEKDLIKMFRNNKNIFVFKIDTKLFFRELEEDEAKHYYNLIKK